MFIIVASTGTATPTDTPSASTQPSASSTLAGAATATNTPTSTAASSASRTKWISRSPTRSMTKTTMPTPTDSASLSISYSFPTATPSESFSLSPTISLTTYSSPPTLSITFTHTYNVSFTKEPTPTHTFTVTYGSLTLSESETFTETGTQSLTVSDGTESLSASMSDSLVDTSTDTIPKTVSVSRSISKSLTVSLTGSSSLSHSHSLSKTFTTSLSAPATLTASQSLSKTFTTSLSGSVSQTGSQSPSTSPTRSESDSSTDSSTYTLSYTAPLTKTDTVTITPPPTPTTTFTESHTESDSLTISGETETISGLTPSLTQTPSVSKTSSATVTPPPTPTVTLTETLTKATPTHPLTPTLTAIVGELTSSFTDLSWEALYPEGIANMTNRSVIAPQGPTPLGTFKLSYDTLSGANIARVFGGQVPPTPQQQVSASSSGVATTLPPTSQPPTTTPQPLQPQSSTGGISGNSAGGSSDSEVSGSSTGSAMQSSSGDATSIAGRGFAQQAVPSPILPDTSVTQCLLFTTPPFDVHKVIKAGGDPNHEDLTQEFITKFFNDVRYFSAVASNDSSIHLSVTPLGQLHIQNHVEFFRHNKSMLEFEQYSVNDPDVLPLFALQRPLEISLRLKDVCMVHRFTTDPVTFTLMPPPYAPLIPPPPIIVRKPTESIGVSVETARGTSAITALVGSPFTAAQLGRSALLLSLINCEADLEQLNPLFGNPTQLTIGAPSPMKHYQGSTIGNIALLVFLIGLHALSGFIYAKVKKTDIMDGFTKVMFPSLSVVPFTLLIEPMAMASVTIIIHATQVAWRVVGGFTVALGVISVPCGVMYMIKTWDAEFVQLTHPSKVDEEDDDDIPLDDADGDAPPATAGGATKEEEEEKKKKDALKSTKTKKGGKCKKVSAWISYGIDGGVDWIDNDPIFNPGYCRRNNLLFMDYRGKYHYFYFVELGIAVMTGILDGIKLGRCEHVAIAVVVFLFALLAMLLVLRPYNSPFLFAFSVFVAFVQLCASLCVVVGLFGGGDIWYDVGEILAVISIWGIVVRAIFDIAPKLKMAVRKAGQVKEKETNLGTRLLEEVDINNDFSPLGEVPDFTVNPDTVDDDQQPAGILLSNNQKTDLFQKAWDDFCYKASGDYSPDQLALTDADGLNDLMTYYGVTKPQDRGQVKGHWALLQGSQDRAAMTFQGGWENFVAKAAGEFSAADLAGCNADALEGMMDHYGVNDATERAQVRGYWAMLQGFSPNKAPNPSTAWNRLCVKAKKDYTPEELALLSAEDLEAIMARYNITKDSERKQIRTYWSQQQEPEFQSWNKLCKLAKADYSAYDLAMTDSSNLNALMDQYGITLEKEKNHIKHHWGTFQKPKERSWNRFCALAQGEHSPYELALLERSRLEDIMTQFGITDPREKVNIRGQWTVLQGGQENTTPTSMKLNPAQLGASWTEFCAKAKKDFTPAELATCTPAKLEAMMNKYECNAAEKAKVQGYWALLQDPSLLSWNQLCAKARGALTECEVLAMNAAELDGVMNRYGMDGAAKDGIRKRWEQQQAEAPLSWNKLCTKVKKEFRYEVDLPRMSRSKLDDILTRYLDGPNDEQGQERARVEAYWASMQGGRQIAWDNLCIKAKGEFTPADLATVKTKANLESLLKKYGVIDESDKSLIIRQWELNQEDSPKAWNTFCVAAAVSGDPGPTEAELATLDSNQLNQMMDSTGIRGAKERAAIRKFWEMLQSESSRAWHAFCRVAQNEFTAPELAVTSSEHLEDLLDQYGITSFAERSLIQDYHSLLQQSPDAGSGSGSRRAATQLSALELAWQNFCDAAKDQFDAEELVDIDADTLAKLLKHYGFLGGVERAQIEAHWAVLQEEKRQTEQAAFDHAAHWDNYEYDENDPAYQQRRKKKKRINLYGDEVSEDDEAEDGEEMGQLHERKRGMSTKRRAARPSMVARAAELEALLGGLGAGDPQPAAPDHCAVSINQEQTELTEFPPVPMQEPSSHHNTAVNPQAGPDAATGTGPDPDLDAILAGEGMDSSQGLGSTLNLAGSSHASTLDLGATQRRLDIL